MLALLMVVMKESHLVVWWELMRVVQWAVQMGI